MSADQRLSERLSERLSVLCIAMAEQYPCLCRAEDAFVYVTAKGESCHLCEHPLVHRCLKEYDNPACRYSSTFGVEYAVVKLELVSKWREEWNDEECDNYVAAIRQFFQRHYGLGVWCNPEDHRHRVRGFPPISR